MLQDQIFIVGALIWCDTIIVINSVKVEAKADII